MSERLAIAGGSRAVPEGTIKPWPPIDDVDRKMTMASLEGTQHAYGPNCKELEREFAAWNDNAFALVTDSGTAALHMGIAACGLSAGDEVIVPAYSWPSSATCIMHHNCIPVFVDIDFDTMNIDTEKIEAAITPRTKAIIPVHLHGLAVDMDRVMEVARRHDLYVIEDACQAHGATFKARKVGTFGHCAAFSTNQNKCLCSGEGGLFVTDDEGIKDRADRLRYFGESRAPEDNPRVHNYGLGWMYRGNDLAAAFARAQLTKLDSYLARQRENAALLSELLRGTPGLIIPTAPEGFGHNWYNYTIRFDLPSLGHDWSDRAFRDSLLKAIQKEGVDTGIWQAFILPDLTVFRAKNAYGGGCPWSCPHAQEVDYDPAQFPMAQRHCDAHTGMTTPLRAPNGEETARAVARGIRKVLENVEQVEELLCAKANG